MQILCPSRSPLVAALFILSVASAALAQPLLKSVLQPVDQAPPTTPAEPPQPVAAKRAENAELLRVAQRKLDGADPADPTVAQQVALFKSVEAVLAQQEAVDQQLTDLATRKTELETQLRTVATSIPAPPAPISFMELDRLKDELSSEQSRAKLATAKLTAAKAALEKSQKAYDSCEKARRQAQEAAETAPADSNKAELVTATEQAKQASQLASETLSLRKKEVTREERSQEVQKLAVQLLQQKVDLISPRVVFSEADLKEQLAQVQKQEAALNAALEKAQTNLQTAQRRLAEARREHDEATGDRTVLAERLEARQRARDRSDVEVNTLTRQLQRLAELPLAWNHRYQIATSRSGAEGTKVAAIPSDELKNWQTATKTALTDLADEARAQILRMSELRGDLATVAKKADAAKDGPAELVQWIDRQRQYLDETLRLHEANLVSIESTRRVYERLSAEVNRGVEALSPTQLALSAWDHAAAIWKTELANIDDNPITVEKVVRGLVIFTAGWILSRIFATLFAYRFLKRFRMSKDASAAIKTLTFYSLLVIVTLFALDAVNIPLTAFTILGGALAIGVGFGSQALINNFISGLIMLAERPVRLGERVVFGTYDGMVEEVGFRSTKLRTLTDHLVTIPNSHLVNEPIENIGRRRTIRRLLHVTITYDTPRETIMEAVEAVRNILEEPGIREPIHPVIGWEKFPPRVYFNDFNAESLNIQVVYWYAPPEFWDYMEHCQRVNLRIVEEFERLGVDFAFPSRTLYLAGDSKRELSVRLSQSGTRAAG